ncbi:MDIS1-interacting receptor like kinase 2-like, partial [Argentina anserina]|uniref:MDIS1-interacting receptor like kinase 2-like n=1 Tax=Argentina anserina TaxID=57926 RepID=UPI0021766CD0
CGHIPSEFGSLKDLEYLDLSTNRLNESIPSTLGGFSNLHYLNLSNNQFSKNIPFQLGNLLSQLDLSHNNLSSSIPRSLEQMSSLVEINMSYNQLQGPVPNNIAIEDTHFEGNEGLCGPMVGLQPCPSMKNKHATKRDRKLVFIIVFPVLGTLLFFLAFLGIVLVRKRSSKLQDTSSNVGHKELYSISEFDGRKMFYEIIKATNDFDALYCIGRGGSGSVYKAKLLSGSIVAVKK